MTGEIPQIRPLLISDTEDILALNRANEVETAFLDKEEFHGLLNTAFYTGTTGNMDGFCIAMDQGAPYESLNFQWFSARFERFIYVDRIIVAANTRGRGIARTLYEDLFRTANGAGYTVVCCEVNVDPPNPASDMFHTRLGFTRIGQQALPGLNKTVSYWTRHKAFVTGGGV